METQTGKFILGAKPLNTVTQEMVVQRAKELAVINGRNGNDYTENDLEDARNELIGFVKTDEDSADNVAPDTGSWQAAAGDRGKRAPVEPAKDEQTFGEDLVQEGIEEATHDTMLAASEEQTRRDQE